jgi:hypothetical protein
MFCLLGMEVGRRCEERRDSELSSLSEWTLVDRVEVLEDMSDGDSIEVIHDTEPRSEQEESEEEESSEEEEESSEEEEPAKPPAPVVKQESKKPEEEPPRLLYTPPPGNATSILLLKIKKQTQSVN